MGFSAALLVCMPVGREGERAVVYFNLSSHCSNFPERGLGGRVLGGFLELVATYFVCMAAGREGERTVFVVLALPPFQLSSAADEG